MRGVLILILVGGFLICSSAVLVASEIDELYGRLDKLEIGRKGYTLGRILTAQQQKFAWENGLPDATPGTYKFKDQELVVVVQAESHRTIVLYEQYEPATREKVQSLVGDLYLEFGNPTVLAHDKIIYWAYDSDGHIPENRYRTAKDKKKNLDIIATIKLSSSDKIIDGDIPEVANLYYIIASEPVLRLLQQP